MLVCLALLLQLVDWRLDGMALFFIVPVLRNIFVALICSAQTLGFDFLRFAFDLLYFFLVWGISTQYFCTLYFVAILLYSLFFNFLAESRGQREDIRSTSGVEVLS